MYVLYVNENPFAVFRTADLMDIRIALLSDKIKDILTDIELYLTEDAWTVEGNRLSNCDYFQIAETLIDEKEYHTSADNGMIEFKLTFVNGVFYI